MFYCSCGFLQMIATEFTAYSKPPAEKLIILKRLFQGRNNMIRVLDCRLNPDHAIRIVIKICRQSFLALQIYTDQLRHLLLW